MSSVGFVATVVANAVLLVLLLGGVTAGALASLGFVLARSRPDTLGTRFQRRMYWLSGAILVVLGGALVLASVPSHVREHWSSAGTWGTTVAGAVMVVLGRLCTVRFRSGRRPD